MNCGRILPQSRNLRSSKLGIALACLAAALLAPPAPEARPEGGQCGSLAVRTKRADDKVEIERDRSKTVVLIRSPFGISQAVIERTADKWPACVVLKLQLKALEHLRLTNGQTTLEAVVSVRDETVSVRLWKDQAEDAPLDSKSPYWIKVRMLGSDGRRSNIIPLRDGVFELTLPAKFFADNPKEITVSWIDFYRG